jgi:hypothetical protein
MAIVIPIALQALSVSARAGDIAARRPMAERLAEQLLNEAIVNRKTNVGVNKGTREQEGVSFEWVVKTDIWSRESMRLLTAEVSYRVQGREHSAALSTLVFP